MSDVVISGLLQPSSPSPGEQCLPPAPVLREPLEPLSEASSKSQTQDLLFCGHLKVVAST